MRIGKGLEARFVMALEQFSHEKRRCVAAEIGRQITYPELPGARVIFPLVLDRRRRETRREGARDAQLLGLV
jgi:hypothetical protein